MGLQTVDLARRYERIELLRVRAPREALVGRPGEAAAQEEVLLQLGVTLHMAEIIGTMQVAFEMTMDWVANRYSFGRPLSSYQEIKHRIADMRTYLEAGAAVTAAAAAHVWAGADESGSWASAGKYFVGRYGTEVIQDCIQMHGGIGVTFDHDLHVLLRRALVDSQLLGPRACTLTG